MGFNEIWVLLCCDASCVKGFLIPGPAYIGQCLS